MKAYASGTTVPPERTRAEIEVTLTRYGAEGFAYATQHAANGASRASRAIFEEEFLSNIVMPDGRTVGDHVAPRIAEAYQGGRVVALLPETTA